MPKTFTFSDFDIGNSQIVPDDKDSGSPTFTIATERNVLDQPNGTTLSLKSSEGDAVLGCIDWKKKTMEVKATTRPYGELKTKMGGMFDSTHEWKWSTTKYVVNRSIQKRTWTATSGNETVAVFTNVKYPAHVFGKAQLATLSFLSEVREEERVFLIFALLFSQLKMPPNEEPVGFKATAGEVGGELAVAGAANLATYGATQAVSTCCIVQ